jgi:hypothetical protein
MSGANVGHANHADLNRLLSIPKLVIFESRVCRGILSLAAALIGPQYVPLPAVDFYDANASLSSTGTIMITNASLPRNPTASWTPRGIR